MNLPAELNTLNIEGALVTKHTSPVSEQLKFTFPNGYGASVVRGAHTYGGSKGFFELAVLGKDGLITYDTSVTSDVEGWCTGERIQALLQEISEL